MTASTALPGSIVVSGSGFTPGGLVYIALYDQWGVTLHEPRWVIASEFIYGPHGSGDPALGFEAGGYVREAFELESETIYGPNGSQDPAQGYRRGLEFSEVSPSSLCPATLMVRAFDQQANSWSNVLDVGAACGQ